MNDNPMRGIVIGAITDVAPDIDAGALRGSDDLRVDLELDSMDFLSVVERLSAGAGIEIPEEAYAELTTIDASADYLARAAAAR